MPSDVLNRMSQFQHEQIVFCSDVPSGLRAIIAIHDTTLGPALGGVRMWSYASEDEALKDALRLSRGMTYKAAISNLPLGGGKAVIMGDPHTIKSKALFEAFGRYVESLNGRYITAEDVNIDVHDVDVVRTQTSHVVGTDASLGGSGDPSPYTALGVFMGLKASAKKVYGDDNLKGKRILVQGVGAVGAKLIHMLAREGAVIIASDIDASRIRNLQKEIPLEAVSHEHYYETHCDILAPCALGGIFNDVTIPRLRCKCIAGGANNQLERVEHADMLRRRGILYAPDYVINAGGLISVFQEIGHYSHQEMEEKVRDIYHTMMNIFDVAEKKGISTALAADHIVEEKLAEAKKARKGRG